MYAREKVGVLAARPRGMVLDAEARGNSPNEGDKVEAPRTDGARVGGEGGLGGKPKRRRGRCHRKHEQEGRAGI